jgi:hypothetical protein
MKQLHLKSQVSRRLLRWIFRIFLTVSAFAMFVPLNGQDEFNGYAFNPKAGICIGKDFEGFGAGLEFSLITNQSIWSFDVYLGENMSILGDSNARFRQVEILFGKYIGTRQLRLQYQGGFAPTWGIKKGYYTDTGDYIEEESYMTFGLTGKLGLKILVSHSVSLGVDLQGNLNLKNPMFFPSVSIEIGKLRERDGEL